MECLRETLCLHELRIALLSYVFAKQTNHPLIVRLEGNDEETLEMLLLFGISYQHLYYQRITLSTIFSLLQPCSIEKKPLSVFALRIKHHLTMERVNILAQMRF